MQQHHWWRESSPSVLPIALKDLAPVAPLSGMEGRPSCPDVYSSVQNWSPQIGGKDRDQPSFEISCFTWEYGEIWCDNPPYRGCDDSRGDFFARFPVLDTDQDQTNSRLPFFVMRCEVRHPKDRISRIRRWWGGSDERAGAESGSNLRSRESRSRHKARQPT